MFALPCERPECDHYNGDHDPDDGHCLVDGCSCPAYLLDNP